MFGVLKRPRGRVSGGTQASGSRAQGPAPGARTALSEGPGKGPVGSRPFGGSGRGQRPVNLSGLSPEVLP